ncbi:hypothetical protein BC831DRAFT_461773 [Entophlyctis helioformis]|nr:hypothetical protein BC831DRAFT_461773 [Entophlyctis helioformis]
MWSKGESATSEPLTKTFKMSQRSASASGTSASGRSGAHAPPGYPPGNACDQAGSCGRIVELADFEHHKENIEPRRGGRKAAALAERFADPPASAASSSSSIGQPPATASDASDSSEARLEAHRKSMEAALESVSPDADDPLEPFFSYIKWVEQYSSSEHPSYMRVLEDSVRRFRKDPRYKNDPRHLQLWIRVARRSRTPLDIFKYLSVNDIGSLAALYYEEYAALLESHGRYDEVEEVLTRGIQRNAHPVDRLNRTLAAFQSRRAANASTRQTAHHGSADSPDADDGTDDQGDENQPRRALMPSAGSSRTADTRRVAQALQPQLPGGIRSAGSSASVRSNAGKVQVFRDENGGDPSASDPVGSRLLPSSSSSNAWPAYDGETQRRKENVREATKWSGATLPQQHASTASRQKIKVFADEEQDPADSQTAKQADRGSVVANKLQEVHRPAAKSAGFLKSLDSEVEPYGKQPATSLTSQQQQKQQPASRKPAAGSVFSYSRDLFRQPNAAEISFEEYRASLPLYRYVPAARRDSGSDGQAMDLGNTSDVEMALDESEDVISTAHPAVSMPLKRPQNAFAIPLQRNQQQQQATRQPQQMSMTSKAKQIGSPTINTKAAMADIFEMFSVPLAAEEEPEQERVAVTASPTSEMSDRLGGRSGGGSGLSRAMAFDDEDETISSKVYRPPATQQQKLGVFRDDSDEDGDGVGGNSSASAIAAAFDAAVPSAAPTRFAMFRDEDKAGRPIGLASSVRATASDENASAAPRPWQSVRSDELDFVGRLGAPMSHIHSTPYHAGRADLAGMDELDDDAGGGSAVGAEPRRSRVILGRHLDPLTPITEASTEFDRTIGGLSTVRRDALSNTILEEADDDTMAHVLRRSLGGHGSSDSLGSDLRAGSSGRSGLSASTALLPGLDRTISSIAALNDSSALLMDSIDSNTFVGRRQGGSGGLTATGSAAAGTGSPALLSADVMRIGRSQSGVDADRLTHSMDQLNVSGIRVDARQRYEAESGATVSMASTAVDGGRPCKTASPVRVPNPCNPYDPAVQQAVLEASDALSLSSSRSHSGQQVGRPRPPVYDNSRQVFAVPVDKGRGKYADIVLDPLGEFKVLNRLGEGGFGQVFLIKQDSQDFNDLLDDDDDDLRDLLDGNDDDMDGSNGVVEPHAALKVETSPSTWEHHVLSTLSSRLTRAEQWYVVGCRSLVLYSNVSCLVLEQCKYGSLLDMLNLASTLSFGVEGGGVNEALAAFWAIEMIRMVGAVHRAGVVHGDIKIDNLMLRFDAVREDVADGGDMSAEEQSMIDGARETWQAQYRADGRGGWGSKGLVLIDWGRAVDTRAFADDQMFVTQVEAAVRHGGGARNKPGRVQGPDESIECLEVRTGKPWRYQPDWYGVAGVIHLLLFRAEMEVVAHNDEDGFGRLALRRPFKRHWQIDLWTPLFDLLLNSGRSGADQPVDGCVDALAPVRQGFEAWLERASVRGSTMLRGLLTSVQSSLMEHLRHKRSGGV